jgi:monoterpene epsilon-lactone hydrolase
MTTANISIGEQALLEHYVASNTETRGGLTPEVGREQDQRWGHVASEPGGVDYVEAEVVGMPAMWLLPAGYVEGKVLLCLHGGGFVGGSMYSHRRLFAHVAKQTGVRALALDYRQLPEHPHPAAAEDTEAAYRWLLGEGLNSVAVVGDSAGGALALGLAITSELPSPSTVVGLSPWTDMTLSGASMETNRRSDALFGGDRPMDLGGMVDFVLGGPGGDRRDPRVSPLHGDLTRLPPTYVQVSGARCCSTMRAAWLTPLRRSCVWMSLPASSTRSRWPPAARLSRMRPSRGSRRGCVTASRCRSGERSRVHARGRAAPPGTARLLLPALGLGAGRRGHGSGRCAPPSRTANQRPSPTGMASLSAWRSSVSAMVASRAPRSSPTRRWCGASRAPAPDRR